MLKCNCVVTTDPALCSYARYHDMVTHTSPFHANLDVVACVTETLIFCHPHKSFSLSEDVYLILILNGTLLDFIASV